MERSSSPSRRDAEVFSTHISHVFLVGDRAYKVKRAVTFPFLDWSTLDKRRWACDREVRLNRRLAPDVYLGVGRFVGPEGEEPVVVMRRMPATRSLAKIAEQNTVASREVERVARVIASFHARAETSDEIAIGGSRDSVRRRWESNLTETQRFIGSLVSAETHAAITRMALSYLEGRGPLFERRIAEHRIRDAHGDLKASDIFCLDDGPRVLDCLEFDDELRHIDVVEDIASLAMDLERLGHPVLAELLLQRYCEFTNDHPPLSLLDQYIAYRALVRAKVACLSHEDGDVEASEQARLLFHLAHDHLAKGVVGCVLIGGSPGTGKTTLASALAASRGWVVLSSDEIRREINEGRLVGSRRTYGSGIYAAHRKDVVYREMVRRAGQLLGLGESVVLDASWSDETHRAAAGAMAARASSRLVEIRCHTSPEIAVSRIAARGRDPLNLSDATPEVAIRMNRDFDPWPEATLLETSGAFPDVIARLLDVLGPGGSMARPISA